MHSGDSGAACAECRAHYVALQVAENLCEFLKIELRERLPRRRNYLRQDAHLAKHNINTRIRSGAHLCDFCSEFNMELS